MFKWILLIILSQMSIKHYKDKIYYIEPSTSEKIQRERVILFNTHVKANKAYLLKNGNVIVYNHDNSIINEYSKDGKLLYSHKINFYPSIIIPSPDGAFVILGEPDRSKIIYKLYRLDIKQDKITNFLTLDTKYFPCLYTPNSRMKEEFKKDKSFERTFYWDVAVDRDFGGGKIIGNNLYLWYSPKVGMAFGGVYKISLKTKKLDVIIKDLDHFCGVDRYGIYYIPFKDKDATEMANTINILKDGKMKQRSFPFLSNNTVFAHDIGATIRDKTLYVFSFSKGKVLNKLQINGKDIGLLGISPSGNRIFLTYRENEKNILSVFDIRIGKLQKIYETSNGKFDNLYYTFDGEGIIFTLKDTLYRGYLDDFYPPYIAVSMPDTVYSDTLKTRVASYDVSFISSGVELELNGNKIKSDTTLVFHLIKGDNLFTFRAKDRAQNVRVVKKHVFYVPKGK